MQCSSSDPRDMSAGWWVRSQENFTTWQHNLDNKVMHNIVNWVPPTNLNEEESGREIYSARAEVLRQLLKSDPNQANLINGRDFTVLHLAGLNHHKPHSPIIAVLKEVNAQFDKITDENCQTSTSVEVLKLRTKSLNRNGVDHTSYIWSMIPYFSQLKQLQMRNSELNFDDPYNKFFGVYEYNAKVRRTLFGHALEEALRKWRMPSVEKVDVAHSRFRGLQVISDLFYAFPNCTHFNFSDCTFLVGTAHGQINAQDDSMIPILTEQFATLKQRNVTLILDDCRFPLPQIEALFGQTALVPRHFQLTRFIPRGLENLDFFVDPKAINELAGRPPGTYMIIVHPNTDHYHLAFINENGHCRDFTFTCDAVNGNYGFFTEIDGQSLCFATLNDILKYFNCKYSFKPLKPSPSRNPV